MLSLFIKYQHQKFLMLVIEKYVGKVECVKGYMKNIQSKTFNSYEKFGRFGREVADSAL